MRGATQSLSWLRWHRAGLRERLVSAVDRMYSRFLHIEVRAPSGRDGFALFGGHRERHRFGRLYFGRSEGQRARLGLHAPDCSARCRQLLHQYGLLVFSGDSVPLDLEQDVLHLPMMVDTVLSVRADMECASRHWSRSARADIVKLTRAGFYCDVQTHLEWIAEFHRRFYRPSITARHGPEAFVLPRSELVKLARSAGVEFLRILRDGHLVGGMVNQSAADGYHLLRLGWRDGDPRLVKEGVASAMYWFGIRRAAQLGHHRIFLGGVSPYLEDGVLFYKGKWGAELHPASRRFGEVRLLIDPAHPSCRRFLNGHSLIARGSDGNLIVLSKRTPSQVAVSPTILAGISRWYLWLDRPDASGGTARDEIPAGLRRWLAEEPLSAPKPVPA